MVTRRRAHWASGLMSDSEFDDYEEEPVHPLFEAISRGDLDAVKRQIAAGVPVDCTDLITDTGHDSGHTPLERAAYNGRVDVIKFLLEAGADVKRRGRWGSTPLLSALTSPTTNDHITCVKVLIAAGAYVNGQGGRPDLNDFPLDKVIGIRKLRADYPSPRSVRDGVVPRCRRMVSILFEAGGTISDVQWRLMEAGHNRDDSIYPYIVKVMNAGGFKAYAKAHRQRLVAMFVRTRCFQPVPDDIVPLIVDYGFHLGFY